MTVHHLFFLHGMGNHSSKWLEEEGVKEKFKRLYEQYDELKRLGGFDERIKCHSIHYNNVFDDQIKRWDEMVTTLRKGLEGTSGISSSNIEALLKFTEKPQEGIDEKEFFYTHILDVLLYKFTLLGDSAVAQCTRQILNKVKEGYKAGDTQFSIIGHSLGTSVVYRLLKDLYSRDEYKELDLTNALRFNLVCQISNTSYALSDDRDNHYKYVVPSKLASGGGVCKRLLNVSHKLDLFAELIPFDPPEGWPNISESKYFVPIRVSHIQEKNIHDISHYLANPKVHVPLFNALFGYQIKVDRYKKAYSEYELSTATGSFKELKEKLEHLKLTDRQSWETLFATIKMFVESTEGLK